MAGSAGGTYSKLTKIVITACLIAAGLWLIDWFKASGMEQRQRKASWEARQAAKLQAAAAKASSPLQPRVLRAGANEVVVIDVPHVDKLLNDVRHQRCYIWRDAEYRTASISCASDAAIDFSDLQE